jgi:hypothetical protein
MTSGMGSNMPSGIGRGMGVMVTDLIFMGWVGCVEQERPPQIFPKLGKIHGGLVWVMARAALVRADRTGTPG